MAPLPAKLRNAAADAQRLLAQGDANGAIKLAEQVALSAPKNADVQTLLAKAYRSLGETEIALSRFRAAAEASNGDLASWQEFVVELLKAGQKGRARNAAKKAPLKGSARKRLLDIANNGIQRGGAALGGAEQADVQAVQDLLRAGRLEEAHAMANLLVSDHPESAFVHNLLGVIALAEERLEDAATSFRQTLRLSPAFSGAAGNLGLTLTQQGKLGEAISVLNDAVAADPKSIDVRTNLANAYFEARFFPETVEQAEKLIKCAPDNYNCLQLMANALNKLGRYGEALPYIDRLAELNDGPEVKLLRFEALAGSGAEDAALNFAASISGMREDLHLRYAELLAELGRFEEARKELMRILAANPENHYAYFRYGAFKRWTVEDPVLANLRDLTRSNVTASGYGRRGFAYYARAKAEMDLHNDPLVFPALDTANRLQSEGVPFDPSRYHDKAQDIMGVWTAKTMEHLSGVGVMGARPILIVGMPRSGSTLIDRILSAHPEIASVGEDTVLDAVFPFDLPARREAVTHSANEGLSAMNGRVGRSARYLDKSLGNFQRVGMLAAAYPQAVFIWPRRDSRSIAFSIYSNAMKVKDHPYSTSLEGIAEFYLYCEKLMMHWKSLLGDRIVEVDYEDLASNPEPSIRSLLNCVGLAWDDACLSPELVPSRVKTLSLSQVRSAINAESVEKWRRFENELRPFTKALEVAGAI